MSVRFLKPLAGLTLALVAAFAQASTVTFDTAAAKKQLSYTDATDATDGYVFASSFLGFPTHSLSLTGTALKEGAAQSLTVFSTTGTAFDLASFDIDSALNVKGVPNLVLLTYTEADGSFGYETLTLDNKSGLQSFSSLLGNLDTLTDLKSFSLSSVWGFTLDNVALSTYVAPTTPVPEPTSLGLMAAGLAQLGITLRRRTA